MVRASPLRRGWADSATYTMSDLTMLRRELVIGYTVAGFLAVLVPTSVWQAVFITGHGFWTSVENALVGPFIAVISFVCSIGNVPLAAALWTGGISFGGVIAFIFADLIAFPLLLIYRRYYGTALMVRMLIVFWALMSTAGLLTELLFRAAGLVPTSRPVTVAPAHFSWNYTTYLNLCSWSSSLSCTGSTATGSVSVAATATHATLCAACRSRRHTRPPRSSTRASATPSARIAAPMSSVDLALAFDLGADPVHLALVARPPRDRARCPRPPPPPRPWAARSAACGAVASRCFFAPGRLVDLLGSGVVRLVR